MERVKVWGLWGERIGQSFKGTLTGAMSESSGIC